MNWEYGIGNFVHLVKTLDVQFAKIVAIVTPNQIDELFGIGFDY